MKLFHSILSILLLLGSSSISAQDIIKMVVGTYNNGATRGIYSFNFDQKDGKAKPLDTLEINNPSYLTFSNNGRTIYAVTENSDNTAALNAISFDKKTGKMILLNTQLTNGEDPCYVETNDKIVLTANYSGGSMSVFGINDNGSLKQMSCQFKGHVGGPDKARQMKAHIHCARFTPDGDHIVATDFSADKILKYNLSHGTDIKEAGVAGAASKASGPRHLIFSHNGHYAYLMSEISGAVTVFRQHDGNMVKIQEIRSDSVGGQGGADIHISPDGRFLYSSNRLKADGIAIFDVNQKDGTLKRLGYQLTGIHPRNFNITPNGKFLLCACRDSNEIQVFNINQDTGLLTDTHQNIAMSKPVCVKFYPQE
jgi:6-phosphogluconolactonase